MNYKGASHYRCQQKNKREKKKKKSMHDRESMNDQCVQSETFDGGPAGEKEALKAAEQSEKKVLRLRERTITEGSR